MVNPRTVDCHWGYSLASPQSTDCEMKRVSAAGGSLCIRTHAGGEYVPFSGMYAVTAIPKGAYIPKCGTYAPPAATQYVIENKWGWKSGRSGYRRPHSHAEAEQGEPGTARKGRSGKSEREGAGTGDPLQCGQAGTRVAFRPALALRACAPYAVRRRRRPR